MERRFKLDFKPLGKKRSGVVCQMCSKQILTRYGRTKKHRVICPYCGYGNLNGEQNPRYHRKYYDLAIPKLRGHNAYH